jgi:predicted PurR-regulated permease PerM
LSRKRITVGALDQITAQVQRYLLVQLLTSLIVGAATWLILASIGMQRSAVWGLAAGITNLVPYLGAVVIMAASMLVGFMQFGTLKMAILIGCVSLGIHGVVGSLLTPWWVGRAGRMSPVTVFVAVLAWGWLWGVWGLLLGVPVLMAVKVSCDHIEDLKPIGEFLGT